MSNLSPSRAHCEGHFATVSKHLYSFCNVLKINSFCAEMWSCTVYVSTVKTFGLHTDLSKCLPKFCFFFGVGFITVCARWCSWFLTISLGLSVFCWTADFMHWCDVHLLDIFLEQVRFKDTPTWTANKGHLLCAQTRYTLPGGTESQIILTLHTVVRGNIEATITRESSTFSYPYVNTI